MGVFGFTAHQRREAFERLIQALIFTGIVQALLVVTHFTAIHIGGYISFGRWTPNAEIVLSVVFGCLVGLVAAICANRDIPHRWLRERGLTTRTSLPSEWCAAFHSERRMVVLHRKDGRRLYGEPVEWPDENETGHFIIEKPCWVLPETGERHRMSTVYRIVIAAIDVDWVELETLPEEHALSDEELRLQASKITKLYQGDKS